jgi:hypothetical protein
VDRVVGAPPKTLDATSDSVTAWRRRRDPADDDHDTIPDPAAPSGPTARLSVRPGTQPRAQASGSVRPDAAMEDHVTRLGTQQRPAIVRVQTAERAQQILALCNQYGI